MIKVIIQICFETPSQYKKINKKLFKTI